MSRRRKQAMFVLAIAVLVALVLFGSNVAFEAALSGSDVFPGDVVIREVSSAGVDWVRLYNNTERRIDLSGFVFTDGDNRFVLPSGTQLEAGGEIRLASSDDKGELPWEPDLYWGPWGINKKGEAVLLIDNDDERVIDFVYVPRMSAGKTLVREMGMARTYYFQQSRRIIKQIGGDLKASVLFLGTLLGSVATLLANIGKVIKALDRLLGRADHDQPKAAERGT